MRPRTAVILGGGLLAAATLVLAGYQVATVYAREDARLLDIVSPALAVVTSLVCIGVLDWVHNLDSEPVRRAAEPSDSRRAAEAPAPTPTPETQRRRELVATVHVLERLADDERPPERVIEDMLKTLAVFTHATALTLWTTGPERSEVAGASEGGGQGAPWPEEAGAALRLRAHYEAGRTTHGEKAGQPPPATDLLSELLERRQPLVSVGDAATAILLPLLSGRDCVGVLKLLAAARSSREEGESAAQRLCADLAVFAPRVARALQAPDLYRASLVDPATGLFTRRHFVDRLNEAAGVSRRYGEPLALAILDIDKLERLNRRYGQATGDRVLASTAALVLDNIRACDTAYRVGADDIALLLPSTDADSAATLAERLCRAAGVERILADDGTEVLITLSAGVAGFDEEMRGVGELMARAEEALHTAKAGTAGRVVRWEERAQVPSPGGPTH